MFGDVLNVPSQNILASTYLLHLTRFSRIFHEHPILYLYSDFTVAGLKWILFISYLRSEVYRIISKQPIILTLVILNARWLHSIFTHVLKLLYPKLGLLGSYMGAVLSAVIQSYGVPSIHPFFVCSFFLTCNKWSHKTFCINPSKIFLWMLRYLLSYLIYRWLVNLEAATTLLITAVIGIAVLFFVVLIVHGKLIIYTWITSNEFCQSIGNTCFMASIHLMRWISL